MTELSTTLLPTDDPGDNSSGTKLKRTWFQTWLDAINALIHSATNPTVTPEDIIDEVVTARGNLASLEDRIVGVIDVDGNFVGTLGNNLDFSITFGATTSARQCVYMSDGTDGRTAGRWYLIDGSAPLNAKVALVVSGGLAGTTGLIRTGGIMTGFVGLTAGTLYYADTASPGSLTSTAPANVFPLGRADSTTSLVIQDRLNYASATLPGIVSIIAQTIAGLKTFATAPLFAPGSVAVAAMDATVNGTFHKGVTATGSSTAGVVQLSGNITVKANTLDVDGKGLRFTTQCLTAANVNNKRIIVYYGGVSIHDTGVFTGPGSAQVLTFETWIVRTGASAQKTVVRWGSSPAGGGAYGFTAFRFATAVNNAVDNTYKVEASAAVANNDIVHEYTQGEVIG